MKKVLTVFICLFGLLSCAIDEDVPQNPFVVAFESPSSNLGKIRDSKTIKLRLSERSKSAGFVKIKVESLNIELGENFTTIPETVDNYLILSFDENVEDLSFEFVNLNEDLDESNQEAQIQFKIEEINYTAYNAIQGYSAHIISFSSIIGDVVQPEIGGPNEQNQVYYDLSTGDSFTIQRDHWDLGFYSGEEFRVILNGSIYMATKALDIYDIDEINSNDIAPNLLEEVKIGTFSPDNNEFVDDPTGDLNNTAIQEITVDPNNNQVYLLNLGYTVGSSEPNNGSVLITGEERGWKKIKIIRSTTGYILQYADLDDTSHQEIAIEKNSDYHFTHFSFDTQAILYAQPKKHNWDLCFTVFTNTISTADNQPAGSYGFSDFVVNNILSDAKAFMVEDETLNGYEDFILDTQVAYSQLSNDQRAIGSNWRDVFEGIFPNRFFVLNDTEGNWYKIRFLSFKNDLGTRGYPKFEYQLLN